MKVRYKNNWLGYAWSVAQSLLFTAVYYVALPVSSSRLEIPGYPYPLFLIAGQFPWQWFASSVRDAPMAFIANVAHQEGPLPAQRPHREQRPGRCGPLCC